MLCMFGTKEFCVYVCYGTLSCYKVVVKVERSGQLNLPIQPLGDLIPPLRSLEVMLVIVTVPRMALRGGGGGKGKEEIGKEDKE